MIVKENPVKLIGSGSSGVVSVYMTIMAASTEEGSIYLMAKDTIKELLIDDSALSDRAKVDLITKTISEISLGITEHAMDVAVKMCTEDRDSSLALTKIESSYYLDDAKRLKLLADTDVVKEKTELTKQQVNASIVEGWVKQAIMY